MILLQYENKPGEKISVPNQWPVASVLKPAETPYTLVMGVHPHCPCTRATMDELAIIMTHAQSKLKGYVIFIEPPGFNANWAKTDLYRYALAISGIETIIDHNGQEADLFHMTTSGQTLVFDKNGKLFFSGGITASRGHVGGNRGVDTILELVRTGKASYRETPFFGCPLFKSKDFGREAGKK